jgi:hypothetical protein
MLADLGAQFILRPRTLETRCYQVSRPLLLNWPRTTTKRAFNKGGICESTRSRARFDRPLQVPGDSVALTLGVFNQNAPRQGHCTLKTAIDSELPHLNRIEIPFYLVSVQRELPYYKYAESVLSSQTTYLE